MKKSLLGYYDKPTESLNYSDKFYKIYNDCYIIKNENKIKYYKKNNPITFEIIYNCILNSKEINYNKIQNILKTKLK